MTAPLEISHGSYWARLYPARFGWYAMYGHGPASLNERLSRAWTLERLEHKADRKLARWQGRDDRNDAKVQEARERRELGR